MKIMGSIIRKRKVAAAIYMLQMEDKKKRQRSCWVREWLSQRKTYGAFSTLVQDLKTSYVKGYENFLRMTNEDLEELMRMIGDSIAKEDTKFREAIPPKERLVITLRFLASGDSFASMSYLFRVAQSTISQIIPEVCEALYASLLIYMRVPETAEEWRKIAKDFNELWNFPLCLGALDGKHIAMQAPSNSGSVYFNYKKSHSIVLLALVDASYCFTYVYVGCNGRVADGGVFAHSTLAKALEENTVSIPCKEKLPGMQKDMSYVVLADDAFPLKEYLMKPYPMLNNKMPGSFRIFNYRLSRARRVVENTFGILSAVFRVFRAPLNVNVHKAETITKAACSLHNFLMKRKQSRGRYAPTGTFDFEEADGQYREGSWRSCSSNTSLLPLLQQGSNMHSKGSASNRQEFTNYFLTPQGEIPWQYKLM